MKYRFGVVYFYLLYIFNTVLFFLYRNFRKIFCVILFRFIDI